MKFYVIRVQYADGDWSAPWSLFNTDYENALRRFKAEIGLDDVAEITMRQRPTSEASFYGRTDIGGGAIQHHDISWSEAD